MPTLIDRFPTLDYDRILDALEAVAPLVLDPIDWLMWQLDRHDLDAYHDPDLGELTFLYGTRALLTIRTQG